MYSQPLADVLQRLLNSLIVKVCYLATCSAPDVVVMGRGVVSQLNQAITAEANILSHAHFTKEVERPITGNCVYPVFISLL